jgi:hypothetical protein
MNPEMLPSFSTRAKSIVVDSLYEHCKGLRYNRHSSAKSKFL